MNLKKRYQENAIFRNLTVYIGSNVVGQLIGILVSPILTRLFSPESYGVQSVYLSVISMICVVSTLSYQNAIVISEDTEDTNIVLLCFVILSVISVFLTIILMIWGDRILRLFNSEPIIPYKYLIPISVFCISSYNILSQYAIKYKSFPVISRTKIKQTLYGNIAKVALGILNCGTLGLLIGNVFSQSIGVIELLKNFIKKKKEKGNVFSRTKASILATKYRRFAYISTPCNYIYTLGSQIPVIMLSMMYNSEIAGFYGLSYSAVFLPCNLIGMALSQVFYAEIAAKRKEKDIVVFINMILKKTCFYSAIPFLLIAIIAPSLFVIVYGDNWLMAGVFARILAIQAFFYFIILPVNKVFEVFEMQQIDLFLNIIRVIVLLLVFIVSKKAGLNATQTLFVFSIFGGLIYVILLLIMEIMLKRIVDTRKG